MYLDIVYIYVHSKCNVSWKAKTSYNLERMEYYSRLPQAVDFFLHTEMASCQQKKHWTFCEGKFLNQAKKLI